MASQALQAMQQENWDRAYALTAQSQDPLLAKLYYWERFQTDGSDISFERLTHFIENNKDWPEISRIKRQLENDISSDVPPEKIIAWFDENAPLTATGLDHYAAALRKQGHEERLKGVIGTWWATTLMSQNDQKEIYNKYKSYIPLESHRRRFDKLLFNQQYSNARAVAKVLGAGYSELAEARIALAAQTGDVDGLIRRVPANLQSDPGLLYERLKWRRKKGMNDRAMEILFNAPPANKIINPDDWWQERHIMIRRMLEDKRYESAYLLATSHKQTEGFSYAQAEWLAGWLALRFMNKPAEAYQRFEALSYKVSTPVSKARAAYWAGRAASALKADILSRKWFEEAAKYQTVFYGQKAGQQIGVQEALKNAAPPVLTQEDIVRFDQNQLIQAALLYAKADIDKRSSDFLWAFVTAENSPKAFRYAAEKAAKVERYHDVIRIAKEATKRGLFLTLQSYPTILTAMQSADKRVEWALLHALIRQESQFNPKAQSPAGALGLMQVMPATAKEIARKNGVLHRTEWLTQKPYHNIELGSRFLGDLLQRYDGNYPMAIAAYNAGPGRVTQWIEQFGDPRSGKVDPIDWIELIPIYETRNYVMRVMEGLYVYRLRLKDKNRAPPYTLAYNGE